MLLRTLFFKLQVSLHRLLNDELISYHLVLRVFRIKTDSALKSCGYPESLNEVLNPSNEYQCLADPALMSTHQHNRCILPLVL